MNANSIQLLEISILLAGPIPDIGGMCGFFREHFLKKVHAPPKQISFLTNYNGNIFSVLRALD